MRLLLRKLFFDIPTKISDQTNVNKPIVMNMAADTLAQIGATSADLCEREGVRDFGEKTDAISALSEDDLKKFPELRVDEVVAQREEDLSFYRQQRERARREHENIPRAVAF